MKKTNIKASLLLDEKLPMVSFELIQQRDQYIIEKRFSGHTLKEIGDSLGLTRERIRQIIQIKNGPNTKTVSKIRLKKYRKEIIDFVRNNPNFNRVELAKNIEISPQQLKKFLGFEFKRLANNRNNKKQRYTDSDLIQILRNSELNQDGLLTAAAFTRNGGKPTVAVFISRFGTWKAACDLAGVQAGKGRGKYTRKQTNLELLTFVEKYLNETKSTGSAEDYDRWQKLNANAPSLALLRQRLGKWNDIKKSLAKFIE